MNTGFDVIDKISKPCNYKRKNGIYFFIFHLLETKRNYGRILYISYIHKYIWIFLPPFYCFLAPFSYSPRPSVSHYLRCTFFLLVFLLFVSHLFLLLPMIIFPRDQRRPTLFPCLTVWRLILPHISLLFSAFFSFSQPYWFVLSQKTLVVCYSYSDFIFMHTFSFVSVYIHWPFLQCGLMLLA